MKVQQHLVRLYPKAWRERYEEEFLVTLEQRRLSVLDCIDLIAGALDSHLHPELGTSGLSVQKKLLLTISTLRHSLLTIFCTYIGFIVAGGAFEKMTRSGALIEVTQMNNLVGLSFLVVMAGAFIALTALLAAGLPIAAVVVRYTHTQRRFSFLLLAVPLLACVVFLGTLNLLKILFPPSGPHLLMGQVFIPPGILSSMFITVAIISAGGVYFATTRSIISEQFLRFAVFPLALVTISMVLMLTATIVWGLGLYNVAPYLFASNNGLMRSSTVGTWLEVVMIMAIATVVACISLLRGLRARSALRTVTT